MAVSLSPASGSGSADGLDGTISAHHTNPLDGGETCSFLALDAARGCQAPRSCASCLETTGCMVNPVGKCVSLRDDNEDPSLEYHQAITSKLVISDAAQVTNDARLNTTQVWQFPARDVRYCSADDAKCRACTSSNFWRSNATLPDSRFCLGDDGACVCIDACERRWYVQEDCSMAAITPALSQTPSDAAATILSRGVAGTVAFCVFLVAVFVHRKCSPEELARVRLLESTRAREARRNARARALGVNPLTLTGWESYRRSLIDKEAADRSKPTQVGLRPDGGLADTGESRDESEEVESPHTVVPGSVNVSLEESDSRPTRARPATVSTAARSSRLSSDVEAAASRQALAPLAACDLGASM